MAEGTLANRTAETNDSADAAAREFIARWQSSGSAERANYGLFLTELCDLLAVPHPQPTRPDDRDNAYVFERAVPMDDGNGKFTTGFIDRTRHRDLRRLLPAGQDLHALPRRPHLPRPAGQLGWYSHLRMIPQSELVSERPSAIICQLCVASMWCGIQDLDNSIPQGVAYGGVCNGMEADGYAEGIFTRLGVGAVIGAPTAIALLQHFIRRCATWRFHANAEGTS